VQPSGDDVPTGRPGIIGRLDERVRRHSGDLGERARSWLLTRALRRFILIDGKNRTLIMASQAFTAVIPLLLVIGSVGEQSHEQNRFADSLVRRFRLEGQAATSLHTLFSRAPGPAGGVGVLSAVLLLFSLLTLARVMQNTFEAAWSMPLAGFRRTVYSFSGTVTLLAELIVLTLLASLIRGIPGRPVTSLLIRVVGSILFWMVLQYLLLSRRVPWRALVPGAVLAGIGQVVISLLSALYMPHLIATNSARYGAIGVALALVTWLLIIAVAVVVGAVVGAELAGRPPPRGGTGLGGAAVGPF
jgi:membrane protein